MKNVTIAVLLVAAILAPSVSIADELNDGLKICNEHKLPYRDGPVGVRKIWRDGWDHCQIIVTKWSERDAEMQAASKDREALEKTKELSKRLGAK